MKVTFQIKKGVVASSLKLMSEQVSSDVHEAMKATAERAVELAKDYVPEDTGALKDSIDYVRVGDRPSRRGYRLTVGSAEPMPNPRNPLKTITTADYAKLVHENYWSSVAILPSDKTAQKIITHGPAKVTEGFLRHAMLDATREFERRFDIIVDKARLRFNR